MLHHFVTSSPFVGRVAELRALGGLLHSAIDGHGAAAVIGADAGVGKTRLCRELKTAAAAQHFRVIEGRCSPAESNVPYAPFIDALRFRLARGESAEAADVLKPVLAHVAPLLPGLASASQLESANAQATDIPFERIFGVFQRLASLGPVLFIIEDVHWADAITRDLLHFMARRIAALPMMLLVTYRTDEIHAGHPVHRLISGITREPNALRVQLEPLDLQESAELVAALCDAEPDADFARAVFERTDGNPLFVEELIASLSHTFAERSGRFTTTDLQHVSTPHTVADMVRDRVAPLSTEAREALQVAAVIGRTFRFDVLADALGWSEERLLPAVEELVERALLQEIVEQKDEVFTFRHSLVQEVMYASAIGRRRRLWHRRVAAALEKHAANAQLVHTVLAHHYSRGGELEQARYHLLLGGDEAVRLCAWQHAEAVYEEALTIVEGEHKDESVEADILERLAEVAWWQNRVDAVAQYASEALAIRRRRNESHQAAMLLRRLARLDAHQRGKFDRAIARLLEAIDMVPPASPDRAVLFNDLGRVRHASGDWRKATELFEASILISSSRSDCDEEALSLVMLGWIAIREGSIGTGVQRLELARSLVEHESVSIDRAFDVYHAGIRALDAAREHHRAASWLEAATDHARRHAAHGDLMIYHAYEASTQRRSGVSENALRTATDAVAELRLMERAELREALRIHGDVHRQRGNIDEARKAYEEAVDLGETDASIGLALLYMLEHRWKAAASALAAALARANPDDRLFAMRVLPILIEARISSGDVDSASNDVLRLEQLVNGSDYRAGRAALAESQALVLIARSQKEDAQVSVRTAARLWGELGLPYETARANLLLARVLAESDQTSESGELAAESAQTFSALQAKLELAQAESLLRQMGMRGRVRRAAPELPPKLRELTGREAEVLAELSRGSTNKQIAKTLAMSPKTVGNHVGSILSKLGCATRTEAAQIYTRLMSAR